jgi:hypothetical protein
LRAAGRNGRWAATKELLPAATAEKSRVYLLDVPGEAEKLIWQMQA